MESAHRENREAEKKQQIRLLRDQAAEEIRQGEAYEQAGQPALAEVRFLRALQAQEQLLALTAAQTDADAARDSCLSLADLCMQQGNMHGADVYYVRAMGYAQGLGEMIEK